MISRLGPPLTVALLAGPVLFGLAGTVLPAFGYLPVLGSTDLTVRHFHDFLALPGISASIGLSLAAGIASAGLSVGVVALFLGGWAGTRTFARLQHLVSPLLSVPHAAAAFGLAFLIAPSGMIFYDGEAFPDWQGDLFVGGLASTALVRLDVDGDSVSGEERLLESLGLRIRDVAQGPDGVIYVARDEADGQILCISPAGQ